MRAYAALFVLAACSSPAKPAATFPSRPDTSVGAMAPPVAASKPAPGSIAAPPEKIAENTPKTTVGGNTFIAAAGWTLRVRATGTILESPEGGSFIAIYDLADAKDADAAIAQAWTLYQDRAPYAVINSVAVADTDGWSKIRGYGYDVPPNLERVVAADSRFANGAWTAVILDVANAVAEKLGELYQYSNALAAAAGFIGGHVAYPQLELGAAFDKAMQVLVFDPLKMRNTTFDFAKGQRGNAAVPHAPDVDGKPALAIAKLNTSFAPIRPAGGAWSTVNDMLKYVQMELAEGTIGGKPYIGKEALIARRAPQVAIGTDATYGMGLIVDKTWGVTVVRHGGSLIGFHGDMMWLPEHGVGAVILTNGDPGWMIRRLFQRKLLEVMFDAKPEADGQLAAEAQAFFESIAAQRKLLTVPADPTLAGKLAARYTSPALGEIAVKNAGAKTVFDFGEYASQVASRTNPDGSVSFITIEPGIPAFEFVVGEKDGNPTLTIRDGQHEYVLTQVDQSSSRD